MHKKDSIIYGTRPVMEAVKMGKDIEKVLLKKGGRGDASGELLRDLKQYGIPFQFVPAEKLNKITKKNHQGVIAFISPIPYRDLTEIIQSVFERGKDPLLVLLDRVTDVRNFGAIARTAECLGADAILVPAKESAQINEDAVKTSAGALNKIPVCRSFDIRASMEYLKFSGLSSVYTHQSAEKFVHEADLNGPLVMVMGAEDKGVSRELAEMCDTGVKIPMSGSIDSLNVSVAAGIILYEAQKQRRR